MAAARFLAVAALAAAPILIAGIAAMPSDADSAWARDAWGSAAAAGAAMPMAIISRLKKWRSGRKFQGAPEDGDGDGGGRTPSPPKEDPRMWRGAEEWVGSMFCNPGGLPEGGAPDIERMERDGPRPGTEKKEMDWPLAHRPEQQPAEQPEQPPEQPPARHWERPPGAWSDMQVDGAPAERPARRRGAKVPSNMFSRSPTYDAIRPMRRRRKGGSAKGGKKSRKRKRAQRPSGPCAVLDTNAAVLYGRYMSDKKPGKIHPSFREVLCDDSIDKVVTPVVMKEVWGLFNGKRIDKQTVQNIKSLAVGRDCLDREAGLRIAREIEADQRRLIFETDSSIATSWLAAKRKHHEKAAGKDYGDVKKMRPINRYNHMSKLCDMAAGDRAVMGEAGAVSMGRERTVLLSSDADVSLFEYALKKAVAGRNISVVTIPPASRRGYDW